LSLFGRPELRAPSVDDDPDETDEDSENASQDTGISFS
jgi:hypothetical protein